ncbi:uncharacterized protein LOC120403031 [Mauremys reevesii]|uniref:uncharacterized protein LOC120403031 n=1 Tax=Mauremys reevesii TaxID=260615 RepID=UPI00193F8105|nr:uncharacterized protein LOC120403031 [Mauremys reevesii]
MRHWNKQPLRRDPATAVAGSVVSPRPVRVQTVLPSMFDAGVGIMQSWFCACFDSSWVLYTCILLVLVIWVAMATQHSFSWRSRMALLVSRLRWRGTEDEGEGAKKRQVKQPRDRLCWDPPRRARQAARRRSIRQLLCDNSDCALCDEAARQAERLVYADRASAWVPAGPGSPPTPASGSKGRNLLGRSMWRGLDVLQWCGFRTSMGDQVLPPAQGPFPPSKSRSPPEQQAGSRKTECRPSREDEERLSRPQQAKGSSTEQDECLFCSSLWNETLLRGQEHAQSSSSLQHEPPLLAWELRNGSSQHEPFLPRHEEHPGPAPAQHEPFPPSQAEHGWVGSFLRRGRARSPQAAPQRHVHPPDWVPFLAKSPGRTRMSGRKAKWQRDQESTAPRATGEAPMSLAGRPLARVSPGALRVAGRLELAEVETPFLQRDVRASLEWHVQVKRLQLTLGLPCTLQSALKIFMPPAPKPIASKPSGAGMVVTMPQTLPFLSVGSRTELERHLQRMVHLKRWGLPKRIQESLRLLMPATPPHPRLSPLPSGRWAPRGPGPVTRAAQMPGLRARAPAQASQGPARASRSAPGSHCYRDTRELQVHIARKGLEIRLGALPAVLRSSQKMAALGRRDLLLPKLIPPGCKAPLARHQLCPLLSCKAGSMELNVRHKHIQYLWALPTLRAPGNCMAPAAQPGHMPPAAEETCDQEKHTDPSGPHPPQGPTLTGSCPPGGGCPHYRQSLAKLFHAGPSPAPPPSSSRAAGTKFTEQELPFLPPGAREELELHVRKKRLQHEWGLPLIIQKSMRGLMAAPPRPGQPKAPPPADSDVAVLQPELSFLSEGSRRELELSLRKRLMHRRWGLPRRIQESVRLLQPASAHAELRPHGPTERDAEGPFLLPWHKSAVHLEWGVGKARRVVAAPHPRLSLGRDAQKWLQIHVAKKCVETRLGAVPTAVRRSWQRLHLVSRLPLPKLIPAGDRAPKARSPLLPFVHSEDVCHLELNVQHKHLMALWGLGTLYTQSLSRMVPRAPPGPVPPREAEVEFWAREALFLGPEARQALELHVRKKRLQHEWGFPALIERSLRAFVPEPPLPGPTAARQRAELHILVLGQETSLMDGDTRGHLERHLRKMTLQRRWGLPRRMQESLRLFAAFAPPTGPQLPGAGGERSVGQSRLRPSQPDVPAGSRLAGDSRTHGLAAEWRDELQRHLARKCLEIRLGVRPALVKRSQRVARDGERIRLPRLICAGQKPPKPRAGSLLCLPPTAVNTLDMNVRHKQLVHFWGLPTLQAASLRRMMPKAPAVPLGSAAGRARIQMGLAGCIGAEEPERNGYKEPPLVTGPPLVTAEARDHLESHILRKKLQHEWGLPRVVLRSLGAFTPPPPGRGPPRRAQAPASESFTTGSLLFLHTETREHLESHVRKLALERRWGLPKRILESLQMFLPPAQPGAEPRGQTQPLLHVSPTPPQGPTALCTGQLEELQPGPGEPLTHRSQHWLEMGVKEGKASCSEAVSQHTLGSSSRRSQETSQTSNGEGPPSSPRRFLEDKAELTSTLDFPRKKVLRISHRAQESQRRTLRRVAHESYPQQREQNSEEIPGQWRTHDGEGAPWMAGTGRRSRSSSVETAVWNEKRISRELESSFRRIARSRSHHGPGGKQPLSLEIVGHLEMGHCTCLDCPCCKIKGWDGARSLGASSPGWQTQRIHARGSAALLGDAAAPTPLHAEPGWQGQDTPSVAKYEPPASSQSSPEGSESRASDWSEGESSRAASRPAPKGPTLARVHLASPRAAAHRLDIHLAQKVLGSFILPPCVIHSQAIYADMAAERLRAAAQEHRREMNIRLQRRRGRKSQLGGPRDDVSTALGQ